MAPASAISIVRTLSVLQEGVAGQMDQGSPQPHRGAIRRQAASVEAVSLLRRDLCRSCTPDACAVVRKESKARKNRADQDFLASQPLGSPQD